MHLCDIKWGIYFYDVNTEVPVKYLFFMYMW